MMLRAKSPEMFRLPAGHMTDDGWMAPKVYKIMKESEPARLGDLPAKIAKVAESYNGPMPADVDSFDVAEYQRGVERACD